MRRNVFAQSLALFLSLLLILPNSALALRPAGPDNPRGGVRVGLEEALQPSLSAGAEEGGKKSVLGWLPVAAVLVGAAISTWVALNFIQPGKQAGPGPLQQPPAKVVPRGKEAASLKGGAFAALRQKLGPDRQIGIIVWDPTDLVKKADLKDFFADSVREGIDTVYLSGYRFMGRLRHSERQSLLDSASKAGVRRIVFIDGNDDWTIRNKNFVNGFYKALVQEADQLDWHEMEKDYATDIEQYPNRNWKGDMGPRVDLVEQVVLPRVNESKRKGPLWEFHPWWMEPDRRTDSGAVIQKLRFPKGTGISVMSYGGSAEDILRLTGPTRRQALEHLLPWQFGVETIPGQGVPHFGGSKAGQIPRVLADTVDLIRARDPKAFDRLGGVYVHTKGPTEGLRVVNGLGGGRDKAEGKPPAVKPAPRFGVQGDKAAVFTGQRIVLNLNFSKAELTGERWVAVPFTKIKEDLWYIQPTADEGAAFPITLTDKEGEFNASVELKAHPNRPFNAPLVEKIKVVSMPESKFEGALEAYNLQANNPLTAPGAMSAAIRAAGANVRVIDLNRKGNAAVRSGGLEERPEFPRDLYETAEAKSRIAVLLEPGLVAPPREGADLFDTEIALIGLSGVLRNRLHLPLDVDLRMGLLTEENLKTYRGFHTIQVRRASIAGLEEVKVPWSHVPLEAARALASGVSTYLVDVTPYLDVRGVTQEQVLSGLEELFTAA